MIDLNLYRFRIGCYNPSLKHKKSRKLDDYTKCNGSPDLGSTQPSILFISILYIYFILCILGTMIGMLIECKFKSFSMLHTPRINDLDMLHMYFTHTKLFSVMLMFFLIMRDIFVHKRSGRLSGLLVRLLKISHQKSTSMGSFVYFIKKFLSVTESCILWIHLLNSILIIICNPSLLNPGPSNEIKVVSFNCQGLIPFSELNSEHPQLDVTKIYEINVYLELEKPDIFMLNETWLKKSIKSGEIFPTDVYKVFRLDRSTKTHPIDPNNPRKFRRNGGGVLIAIRKDLDITSTKLEFQCGAEILGITLKFKDGRKLILCSYYRVGTLGQDNYNVFKDFVNKARSRRGVIGIIIAGDLNMPKINWETFSSTESTDQLFLDSFSDFEFEQLVNSSTHRLGKILDLVLTDKSGLISDVNVNEDNLPCKSDHFSVCFNI